MPAEPAMYAITTSRAVFDDPVDRDRYCAQEYAALDAIGDDAPAERVTNWRRWCWYLARLDGFPESHTKHTGEIVGSGRDAWTAFCQQASIHDLADAMLNRYAAARRAGPRQGRAA